MSAVLSFSELESGVEVGLDLDLELELSLGLRLERLAELEPELDVCYGPLILFRIWLEPVSLSHFCCMVCTKMVFQIFVTT